MGNRILREREVAWLTGLGRTTRYTLERNGVFPRRRKIAANAVGWLENEILAWLRSRAVAGGTPQTAALEAKRRCAGSSGH